MMNHDMLANIEYLREKANVTYEEAEQLLQQHDGNVMRALVELERQGRVYAKASAGKEAEQGQPSYDYRNSEGMKKTKSFINKSIQTRLVVEKKNDDGEAKMIANVPVLFAVLATACAPWLAAGTAGVIAVTGQNVRIQKEEA